MVVVGSDGIVASLRSVGERRRPAAGDMAAATRRRG